MSFRGNERIVLNELETVLDEISQEQVDRAVGLINQSNKIFFHALGRAGYAGKSFVMRLMHMGREVYVMGDTNTPNFEKGDLLIICSGSGETKQFVDLAKKAKGFGGNVLVFTATPGSTLAEMADGVILIKAPSKKQEDSEFVSVQPMASLFEQGILLAGDIIVLGMMEQATDGKEMFKRHSNLE